MVEQETHKLLVGSSNLPVATKGIIVNIIWPQSGTYILAVSGGADSMVLLDLFARASSERDYKLVVGHFNHQTRSDNALDSALVERVSQASGLVFELGVAESSLASEATARVARYSYLNLLKSKYQAAGIITAHHRDDVIETSLLNLARGTDFRGLVPMRSGDVMRPLLKVTRSELRDYAHQRQLVWREDYTNLDVANPRNFLRHELLPLATPSWQQSYERLLFQIGTVSAELELAVDKLVPNWNTTSKSGYRIPREQIRDFAPRELETILAILIHRLQPDLELSHRLVIELAHFAKTAKPGRWRPIRPPWRIVQERDATRLISYTEESIFTGS